MLVLASDHAGFPLKEEIKAYLDEKNVRYEMQKRFPKCKKKRCLPFDFYLTEEKYKEKKETDFLPF